MKKHIFTVVSVGLMGVLAVGCAAIDGEDTGETNDELSMKECKAKRSDVESVAKTACKTTFNQAMSGHGRCIQAVANVASTAKIRMDSAEKELSRVTGKAYWKTECEKQLPGSLCSTVPEYVAAKAQGRTADADKLCSHVKGSWVGDCLDEALDNADESVQASSAASAYKAAKKAYDAAKDEFKDAIAGDRCGVKSTLKAKKSCDGKAEDKAKDAYNACAKQCPGTKGSACIPSEYSKAGNTEAKCGIIKNKEEGGTLGFGDKDFCQCVRTDVCKEYDKAVKKLGKSEGDACTVGGRSGTLGVEVIMTGGKPNSASTTCILD